ARREEAARRVQQRDVRLHAGLDRVARLLNEALEAESVLPLRREMRVVGGDERQGRRESEHEPRDERPDRADRAAIRADGPGTHLPASDQRTYRKGDVWGAGVAMMPEIPTLVVDDEPSIRDLLQLQLSALGCHVAVAQDGKAALALLQSSPIDLVFTDIRMPKMSGIQLLQEIKSLSPETSVVVLS